MPADCRRKERREQGERRVACGVQRAGWVEVRRGGSVGVGLGWRAVGDGRGDMMRGECL